ncbi:ketopantoate reductase family protein [Vibrio olivae]|uniref:2-dehydropantoate 2-reductase n=1 Tax=Vibrio olivae TaxID=1243002 RepID=A0ABV5HS64_9VIBR
MNIAIIGAGGIGCYYGARMLSAGHKVSFIARGAHLKAMQTDGLVVRHEDFQFSQVVDALSLQQLLSTRQCKEFDLIILATKSGTTQQTIEQMKPWILAGEAPVLSIQNGVMNEVTIDKLLGRHRTLGGLAVLIGGHIVEPGMVEVAGASHIELGAWPTCQENAFSQSQLNQWVTAFNQAGIPTTNFDDIQYALWRKLIINNGVNPLSALTWLDTQSLLNDSTLSENVYQMMIETARAANQAGVQIAASDVDDMFKLIKGFDAIKTSMLVDREKGRPMEIDDICGPVIHYCQQSGEPATVTELIACTLKYSAQH